MKVIIVDPTENKNIHLSIPNGIALNRYVLSYILKKSSCKYSISNKQITKLAKEIKNSLKYLQHYELVNVESKDGEIIKLIL